MSHGCMYLYVKITHIQNKHTLFLNLLSTLSYCYHFSLHTFVHAHIEYTSFHYMSFRRTMYLFVDQVGFTAAFPLNAASYQRR